MASVNKVILVGNVGRDPEMNQAGDSLIANVSLATTEVWKDRKTGERNEETEWHRLVFFGKTAEIVRDYVRKGTSLYVEGKIKTQKWQDKDTGADRYSTSIYASVMQMLGGSNASQQNSGQQRPAQSAPAPRQQRRQAQDNNYSQAKQGGLIDDDPVPF